MTNATANFTKEPVTATATCPIDYYLFPVRYALSEPIPGSNQNQELIVNHPSFKPTDTKSRLQTLRRLRAGFLYVYQQASGLKKYIVNQNGELKLENGRSFSKGIQVACAPVWLLYSEIAISDDACIELADVDNAQQRETHMRFINLSQLTDHCFNLTDAPSVMAELNQYTEEIDQVYNSPEINPRQRAIDLQNSQTANYVEIGKREIQAIKTRVSLNNQVNLNRLCSDIDSRIAAAGKAKSVANAAGNINEVARLDAELRSLGLEKVNTYNTHLQRLIENDPEYQRAVANARQREINLQRDTEQFNRSINVEQRRSQRRHISTNLGSWSAEAWDVNKTFSWYDGAKSEKGSQGKLIALEDPMGMLRDINNCQAINNEQNRIWENSNAYKSVFADFIIGLITPNVSEIKTILENELRAELRSNNFNLTQSKVEEIFKLLSEKKELYSELYSLNTRGVSLLRQEVERRNQIFNEEQRINTDLINCIPNENLRNQIDRKVTRYLVEKEANKSPRSPTERLSSVRVNDNVNLNKVNSFLESERAARDTHNQKDQNFIHDRNIYIDKLTPLLSLFYQNNNSIALSAVEKLNNFFIEGFSEQCSISIGVQQIIEKYKQGLNIFKLFISNWIKTLANDLNETGIPSGLENALSSLEESDKNVLKNYLGTEGFDRFENSESAISTAWVDGIIFLTPFFIKMPESKNFTVIIPLVFATYIADNIEETKYIFAGFSTENFSWRVTNPAMINLMRLTKNAAITNATNDIEALVSAADSILGVSKLFPMIALFNSLKPLVLKVDNSNSGPLVIAGALIQIINVIVEKTTSIYNRYRRNNMVKFFAIAGISVIASFVSFINNLKTLINLDQEKYKDRYTEHRINIAMIKLTMSLFSFVGIAFRRLATGRGTVLSRVMGSIGKHPLAKILITGLLIGYETWAVMNEGSPLQRLLYNSYFGKEPKYQNPNTDQQLEQLIDLMKILYMPRLDVRNTSFITHWTRWTIDKFKNLNPVMSLAQRSFQQFVEDLNSNTRYINHNINYDMNDTTENWRIKISLPGAILSDNDDDISYLVADYISKITYESVELPTSENSSQKLFRVKMVAKYPSRYDDMNRFWAPGVQIQNMPKDEGYGLQFSKDITIHSASFIGFVIQILYKSPIASIASDNIDMWYIGDKDGICYLTDRAGNIEEKKDPNLDYDCIIGYEI